VPATTTLEVRERKAKTIVFTTKQSVGADQLDRQQAFTVNGLSPGSYVIRISGTNDNQNRTDSAPLLVSG
jgi:hypothetical protein